MALVSNRPIVKFQIKRWAGQALNCDYSDNTYTFSFMNNLTCHFLIILHHKSSTKKSTIVT